MRKPRQIGPKPRAPKTKGPTTWFYYVVTRDELTAVQRARKIEILDGPFSDHVAALACARKHKADGETNVAVARWDRPQRGNWTPIFGPKPPPELPVKDAEPYRPDYFARQSRLHWR